MNLWRFLTNRSGKDDDARKAHEQTVAAQADLNAQMRRMLDRINEDRTPNDEPNTPRTH
ncbi:hypothetical protein JANAI62_03630 [Jannaschia pagri]|uniref:Uncharacterized protein n=1 Tax=Jannaschia pagri TaxID=2829797 RepID=A0ABQ4NH48_9RHOB|nr:MULTISPECIES: hypothetical protein [unclassified Jannaschia]GIT90154.1 hypothetical protein JANAI61_06120 [Jannaschia sp. AI_61]GIT93740.1 hypothetical protein JANAI62_03630 [Jannaschia sp. AI_62]